jgi:hypothetical protein
MTATPIAVVGCGFEPGAADLDREVRRFLVDVQAA